MLLNKTKGDAVAEESTVSLEVGNIIGVQFVIAELRETEPKLINQLRKDLVGEATPLLPNLRSGIPNTAPLPGMEHRGNTGWAPERIKVTAKANFRKRAGKQTLISFRASTNALRLADMSGRRARGKTPSGQAMIAALSRREGTRPSRYVYPSVEKELPSLQKSMIKIIEEYAAKVSRKIAVEPRGSNE